MTLDTTTAYEKAYQIRVFKGNFAVSVPPQVIRKEAKKNNMSVTEFIEHFQLIAQYDNFEGLHYTFEKAEAKEEEKVNSER